MDLTAKNAENAKARYVADADGNTAARRPYHGDGQRSRMREIDAPYL